MNPAAHPGAAVAIAAGRYNRDHLISFVTTQLARKGVAQEGASESGRSDPDLAFCAAVRIVAAADALSFAGTMIGIILATQ